MARPIDHARKTELALAALDVIRVQGAHRTTMSELAKGLGMKRSSLYWYFKDLGEIFDTVLKHTLSELLAARQAHLTGVEHPIDVLDAHITSVREYFASRSDFIIVMFQLWAAGDRPGPDSVFRRTSAHFELIRQAAAALLQRGIDEGRVAPCDPHVLVDLVGAFVDGCLVHGIARGIDVAPLHALFRERVLTPLRLEETPR
jgi:AcrR family transcriptional regulator